MAVTPNLIIAGVNKAGTTSLFSYLGKHPAVGVSEVKETCFFLPIRYHEQMPPLARYYTYFRHIDPNRQVVVESTPGYFYGGEELAREIRRALGDIRIIIMLRDPVARAISFFNFMKSMLEIDQDLSLTDYIEHCRGLDKMVFLDRANNKYFGVEGGFYCDYIEPWHEAFSRVKVVFFDDMVLDPNQFMIDLSAWLGIDAEVYRGCDLTAENRTTGHQSKLFQAIAIKVNKRFERFFRRTPRLKSWIRKMYQAINATKVVAPDRAQCTVQLNAIYAGANARLRDYLAGKGYDNLPSWLSKPC